MNLGSESARGQAGAGDRAVPRSIDAAVDQDGRPRSWPRRDAGAACVVCGRLLDGSFPVIEVQLRRASLRACRQDCRGFDEMSADTYRNCAADSRTRAAERLGELYKEIEEANSGDDSPFGDIAPMLLKLVRRQCDLLWVTESNRE
jgi:hypothetical protein